MYVFLFRHLATYLVNLVNVGITVTIAYTYITTVHIKHTQLAKSISDLIFMYVYLQVWTDLASVN